VLAKFEAYDSLRPVELAGLTRIRPTCNEYRDKQTTAKSVFTTEQT
jgi:hypothetical protein